MSKIPDGFAGPCPKPQTVRPHHSATTLAHRTFVPLASGRRSCRHPLHPRHKATTPTHRTFVPPASRRRLCLRRTHSSKTRKLHHKKPSAPNRSSICFSTALQPQNFQPIAPASRQHKRRRPPRKRKAKTPHRHNPSRELPRHFPPPPQTPRIERH